MTAARDAAEMLLSERLRLSRKTIRRIVDRLPAALLHQIVVEYFVKTSVDPVIDVQGILPCPFCGGRGDFDGNGNTVMCDECYATAGEHENPSIAAALWNRRVPVRVVAG